MSGNAVYVAVTVGFYLVCAWIVRAGAKRADRRRFWRRANDLLDVELGESPKVAQARRDQAEADRRVCRELESLL
jgi:hypothetical protein